VEPERVSSRRITLRVPRGAASGPVTVLGADGQVSKPTRRGIRVEQVVTRRAGGGIELAVTGKKVFFDGERRPTLTYSVKESGRVVVELVRVEDGVALVRWDQGVVAPGEVRTVSWDGMAGGVVQKEGRYEFRVSTLDSSGAVRASSAQAAPPSSGKPAPVSPDSFVFLRHKFPVRGTHDYGEFQASFGGGRGHQGHDVFAKCGTPLVAARGGIVKLKQHQSRAGNYLVIDGEQTDVDYVYMHLRDPALVEKGDRVHTGQLIGYVGDTGRASGCHLHFELWSGPGWYTGGSPFDPLPELKAWDRFS
jgi:murein DD-endopeptidase MepM/ murein hydrolase activator NlpD